MIIIMIIIKVIIITIIIIIIIMMMIIHLISVVKVPKALISYITSTKKQNKNYIYGHQKQICIKFKHCFVRM